jgi:F-type H+-transporting ATPase subunit delta
MSDFITAARPYAKADFETAQAGSSLAAWSEALALLAAVIADKDLKTVLDSPAMAAAEKGEIVIDICKDQLSDTSRNLVKVLAENARLVLLPEIAKLYEMFRAEAESKIEAVVTSAYVLTDAQLQAMTGALKKKLGSDVTLVTEIDKSLIGGVIIKAGDLVIDGSAKARLASLAKALTH